MNYGILPSFFSSLSFFTSSVLSSPLFPPFPLVPYLGCARSPGPGSGPGPGTPVRRRGRLLHAFHGCVRRIIALAVHIRARGSHGRASLFLFPPRVGFCAARKQQRCGGDGGGGNGEGRTGRQKGVEKVNRADISRR